MCACVCVQALGPEVPVKEAAQGALQKSHRLLNQAKQLQNDVKGNHECVSICTIQYIYLIIIYYMQYNNKGRLLIVI